MAFKHVSGLFSDPAAEWRVIRDANYTVGQVYAQHTLILAAIPALAGLIGTTQIGWSIGAGDPIKLTMGSGIWIAVAYYIAMIVGVYVVGFAIHWMSTTYSEQATPLQICVSLASYTATPLFLVGAVQVYPILWLDLLIGLPALGFTVYLFYLGVPIMFQIDKDRGFLFSTAAMGFGMVALVALLAITALLWGIGLGPKFTS